MRALLVASLGFLLAGPCVAGQRFECGGARVEITITRPRSTPPSEAAKTTIAVSRGGHVRELAYVGGIDFVGGQCLATADGAPRVVFQAYCGGSGCKDQDNWGIMDPLQLQFLLVPSDTNRADAQKILGGVPVPAKHMLSVEREPSRDPEKTR